jgi:putative ABC transport system substrate-binding protein
MLALVLFIAPLAANAQPSSKVYRIGWLSEGSPPCGPIPSIKAFQQGLRDLGYVEGQNLAIAYRYTYCMSRRNFLGGKQLRGR